MAKRPFSTRSMIDRQKLSSAAVIAAIAARCPRRRRVSLGDSWRSEWETNRSCAEFRRLSAWVHACCARKASSGRAFPVTHAPATSE